MSNSLVRKSLELAGFEKEIKHSKKKRKQIKYKGTLDLIPAKHRINSKNDKEDLGAILDRSGRTTVYEVKRKKASQRDTTNQTIKKLLSLSKNRLDSEATSKILERAVRKKYVPQKEKPKEPETTAFTEEDFKQFEKEYVDQ